MNISFITAFRKFKPPFDKIQRSAIYSWKSNDIKVIAPLNEVGLEEKCSNYQNVEFIGDVKRARELGFHHQSPVVSDMISKALPKIDTVMVALINSDIIIPEDFSSILQKMLDKYGYDIYVVGARQNIELEENIDSIEKLKAVWKQKRGSYDQATSSDIFIASKYTWRKIIHEMPDYILGRWGWDNYLHMRAEILKLNKYNCSEAIPILHCNHDFRHILLQEKARERDAASSKHNLGLWEKTRSVYGTTKINMWPKIEL